MFCTSTARPLRIILLLLHRTEIIAARGRQLTRKIFHKYYLYIGTAGIHIYIYIMCLHTILPLRVMSTRRVIYFSFFVPSPQTRAIVSSEAHPPCTYVPRRVHYNNIYVYIKRAPSTRSGHVLILQRCGEIEFFGGRRPPPPPPPKSSDGGAVQAETGWCRNGRSQRSTPTRELYTYNNS